MLKKMFDAFSSLLTSVIYGALLVAATAAAVAAAIFVTMTAYRVIELLWREVFSFSWV
ncbi:hypothetical protein ACFL5Z_12880 [Planctomycetota bacterium]